ncbi:MAG: PAS domain S-box protein [Deltaproteobacteria bacterium]|nr:PAS domain S-box protein [Deltaproteobacteria bacterium]MBW2065391.1 PAS domain S-box protein [Deltaproteobacteria bacterium]
MTNSTEETERTARDRDRLKALLREKEEELKSLRSRGLFLEALYENSGEEILVIDPDFTIREANQTFLSTYRLRREDAVGRKCYEVKEHSANPCIVNDRFCPLVVARKMGKRVEITRSRKVPGSEKRELIQIMVPITTGEEDIEYFLEISRDVTDYKRLSKQLRASEKRFRAILDTATDAIIVIDDQHKIILFNNGAEKIFEYTREEVLGKELDLLIPPQEGKQYQYVRSFLEKNGSQPIGHTLFLKGVRKGGDRFPAEVSLSFLEMAGATTYTFIIRDVTIQRRLEKKLLQAERLAAVGDSAAHVVHELKNPLMVIGGFSSHIKNALSDEKDLQKMDMILDEVRRLERLVADLGEFTREYRLEKRKTNINDLLRDVIKIMAGLHPEGKYSFKEYLSPHVREINCDPDRLKQVFMNIISNGFEAMAEGGIITLSTENIPSGIEIRISDRGKGIPTEGLKRIFEPFYTTRKKGSGLGLPISYKIVEAHQGEINAVSVPGKGTTFIIQLPGP